MLRMWRRIVASVTKSSGGSSLAEQDDVVEDLSSWELVDAPLSEDEDIYSFDRDNVIPECTAPVEAEDAGDQSEPLDGVNISVESVCSLPITFLADVALHDMHHGGSHVYDDDEEGVEDDDDDEFLTWKLMRRLEKRRIKKTGGRRGESKLRKSKRMPYYYNRPGCLFGKHGLGVQHYYI